MEKPNPNHMFSLSKLNERLQLIKSKPGLIKTEDIELVYNFASKITSKEYFSGIIHAVILFGSVMRDEKTKESDIDILVLIDDIETEITPEIASAYSLGVASLLAKLKAESKLHITTLGLLRFWDGVRKGDPIIITIIRNGKAIVDTGFFKPLKAMLEKGMIKPTPEAIIANLRMAETLLRNQPNYYLKSLIDFYWVVINTAQALIMYSGFEPKSPKETPKLFRKAAKKYNLDPELSNLIEKLYKTMKKITNLGIRPKISGKEVDEYRKQVEDFVKKVKKVLKL